MVSTSTAPSRAIVSRLETAIRSGASGHGVSTTPRDLEAGVARGREGQQGVVDRPQTGTRGDHQGQPAGAGQVAHIDARAKRHQQAADPLDDQRRAGGGRIGRGRAMARGIASSAIGRPVSWAARWGETGGP